MYHHPVRPFSIAVYLCTPGGGGGGLAYETDRDAHQKF